VRIISDIRGNFDSFRQRPIVHESLRDLPLPPEEQFNAYSSQVAIWLSRAVNRTPVLKETVERVGALPFGESFELSPAIIDYMLRSGLGHWGADIQRASNVATIGGARVKDFPLIGGVVGRFTMDPNRVSDAMEAYGIVIGRERETFVRPAREYAVDVERYGAAHANARLAAYDAERQAYALLAASGSSAAQRRHPLARLYGVQQGIAHSAGIVGITYDLERQVLEGRLADTEVRTDPRPIALSPVQAAEARDALARIRAVEAHNTMVALRVRQFAGRGLIDVAPALAILKAVSPALHEEYERRLSRGRVADFSEVQGWPAERDRIVGEWRQQVDDDAAASMLRRPPRRLPIGVSRQPATEGAPLQ
jgi:hypothetical protein